jgi:predicted AAA+ superfamily ATPase
LTINIAKEVLSKDCSNKPFLKKFSKARFDDFGGSQSTTS